MPSCHDCVFHNPQKNICTVFMTSPWTARHYPHLCGAPAKAFRQIRWVPRQLPKKDEMYKPDVGYVNDV
jgi:hypothetical protein